MTSRRVNFRTYVTLERDHKVFARCSQFGLQDVGPKRYPPDYFFSKL